MQLDATLGMPSAADRANPAAMDVMRYPAMHMPLHTPQPLPPPQGRPASSKHSGGGGGDKMSETGKVSHWTRGEEGRGSKRGIWASCVCVYVVAGVCHRGVCRGQRQRAVEQLAGLQWRYSSSAQLGHISQH